MHTDLTHYTANKLDDSDATLECYFDDYTMSLWFVYVEGKEIVNLLSDTTIKALEREYELHCRKERNEWNVSMALSAAGLE